jgi:ElaB/YqjD/DUF883 family membrane-anchored ribosome-binding protein
MDEKPEVIEERIEETRHSLAEKLDKLTGKLSGTVETVEETVENVAHKVEDVTETVEHTVENVSETVSEAAEGTVHFFQEAFNLKKHTQNHPWLVVGGAVLVGYVGGRLLTPKSSPRYTGPHGDGWNYFPPPQYETGTGYRSTGQTAQNSQTESAESADSGKGSSGWLSGITDTFGSELSTLKGLALGALFGVARDMITRSLPDQIQGQLRGVFDSATEKVGGKPIEGNLAETSEESDERELARR